MIGGDRLRIAQSLQFLSENYTTDIVYITHDKGAAVIKDFIPQINKEFCFYTPRWMRYLQALRTLFNGRAELVNHYDNHKLKSFVESHISEYDFVFCASVAMGSYLLNHKEIKTYMDMTDSIAMNRTNAAKMACGMWRYLYNIEAKRMASYEKQCLDKFVGVAYISQVDADFIAGGCKMIISNFVREVDANDCCRHEHSSSDIIFIGKMDYAPNILAVDFFARQVLPKMNAKCKFYIVGTKPTNIVEELGKLPNVCVTGFVESVTPYMQSSAIVVAPMLSGSGVQNKILEAMAHGCCVVTTPIGLEGIEHLREALVVCPPDAEKMAESIDELLNNPVLRKAKGREARRVVYENFSRKNIFEQYKTFVKE